MVDSLRLRWPNSALRRAAGKSGGRGMRARGRAILRMADARGGPGRRGSAGRAKGEADAPEAGRPSAILVGGLSTGLALLDTWVGGEGIRARRLRLRPLRAGGAVRRGRGGGVADRRAPRVGGGQQGGAARGPDAVGLAMGEAWQAPPAEALDDLAAAIQDQFEAWLLTPAEADIAGLLLLKGGASGISPRCGAPRKRRSASRRKASTASRVSPAGASSPPTSSKSPFEARRLRGRPIVSGGRFGLRRWLVGGPARRADDPVVVPRPLSGLGAAARGCDRRRAWWSAWVRRRLCRTQSTQVGVEVALEPELGPLEVALQRPVAGRRHGGG